MKTADLQNSLQTSSDLGEEAQGPFHLILGDKKKKTQEAGGRKAGRASKTS